MFLNWDGHLYLPPLGSKAFALPSPLTGCEIEQFTKYNTNTKYTLQNNIMVNLRGNGREQCSQC